MGDLTVNDDIGIDGSSSEDKAVVDGEEGDELENGEAGTVDSEDKNESVVLDGETSFQQSL